MVSHEDAIKALINTGQGHALLPGEVKATTLKAYTVIYVQGDRDANPRKGSLGGMQRRRLITRFAATTDAAARIERDRVSAVLLGAVFTVGGETFGPIRRETFDAPIDDEGDGWWGGSSTWLYA